MAIPASESQHPQTVGPDVLITRQGAAGRITLNRASTHNALTGAMVATMHAALAEFEAAPSISLVIIDSASPRVFSVGGDLDPVRDLLRKGDVKAALACCQHEYALDLTIARFPKPVVCLIDGLVMGGGIGLSAHASHPVATGRARLSLPETSIGWLPDSGINATLAQMPGECGKYLALTGTRIGAGDMLHLGFARHLVQERSVRDLVNALALTGDPSCIDDFECPRPSAPIARLEGDINRLFAGFDLDIIIRRLAGHPPASWQHRALRNIDRNDRSACELALSLLQRVSAQTPLAEVIDHELRMLEKLLRSRHGSLIHPATFSSAQ